MSGLYTTDQVAKLLSISPRTVAKLIDTGLLKGFKLPGSQDRRVVKQTLIDFCIRYEIPLECP